jgi:hypothetical protein
VAKYLMPRALAIRYVQFGRYGILVLVLLLSFGEKLLEAWLRPALLFFDRTMQLVSPFILPTAMQWLR